MLLLTNSKNTQHQQQTLLWQQQRRHFGLWDKFKKEVDQNEEMTQQLDEVRKMREKASEAFDEASERAAAAKTQLDESAQSVKQTVKQTLGVGAAAAAAKKAARDAKRAKAKAEGKELEESEDEADEEDEDIVLPFEEDVEEDDDAEPFEERVAELEEELVEPPLTGGIKNILEREVFFAKQHLKRRRERKLGRARRDAPRDEDDIKYFMRKVRAKRAANEPLAPKVEKKSSHVNPDDDVPEDQLDEDGEKKEWLPPISLGSDETVWETRFANLKEKIRQTSPFKAARQTRRTLQYSDNPVIEQVRGAKEAVEDQIEDARETYETSQHPLVWKVRDAEDAVFGETEQGFAIGEIQFNDPSFSINKFLEEMEHYMIPIVVEACLKGDKELLDSVTEEQAQRVVFASLKERETLGHYWDRRILDISHVDVQNVTMVNEEPLIILSFVCQHVNCVRNAKGKIVEGGQGIFKNVFYQWVLRRDFDSDDFDWKIRELSSQTIFSLV
jgi:import inner membrane translocase subunit TIM44